MKSRHLAFIVLSIIPLAGFANPSSTSPTLSCGGIEIAKNKTALAEIVVPDEASYTERHAAKELADYLGRISGASFVVVSESKASDRLRLLLGTTHVAAPVLADLKGADVDTFVVQQVGRDVVLAGASERATLYAVYDLLERELGCRWLAPGQAWEEIPEKEDVAISLTNRIERPGIKYRFERMTYLPTSGPREKDCLTWAVRQRINVGFEWPTTPEARESYLPYGGFRGYMWPHSLPNLTDIDSLYREHPEYFALVNGKRVKGPAKNVNLCTSDPEVITFVAKMISDSFKAQPQAEFLPVGPGDGTAFCQCKRCQALDTGGSWSHTDGVQQPALGDRWMTFINAVADKVAVTNPGKMIYTLAYHQTFAPPVKVKPQPNVMMMVVNSRPEGVCFVHPVTTVGCANNALFRKYFNEWAEITPAGMMAYQYMPHSTFCMMPLAAPHKFISDIRWLSQQGCDGYEGQSGCHSFGLFGITLYATAKALWNPNIDADALLKDYCDAAFHEASLPMQAFFTTFEQGQKQADHTSTGIWTSFTAELLRQAREQMDTARKTAREDRVKRRLAALDAHFKYAEGGFQVHTLAEEAASKHDKKVLDQAEKLARQTERQFREAQQADPNYVDLDLPPRPLDRFLRYARAAVASSAKGKPASIDVDNKN